VVTDVGDNLEIDSFGFVGFVRVEQPCNLALGGPAKSQLVYEVDALSGKIGKMVDRFVAYLLDSLSPCTKAEAPFLRFLLSQKLASVDVPCHYGYGFVIRFLFQFSFVYIREYVLDDSDSSVGATCKSGY
jgi:hypothetical protein